MINLFFDLETNGINPYDNEIITGYFKPDDMPPYHFKSQVNVWSEEAALIHGISKEEMESYPDKRTALDGLCNYLSSLPKYRAVVYANPNTMLGFLHFDVATLQMELLNHLQIDRLEHQPFQPQEILSVFTMAVNSAKKGIFTPIRNENNRVSYSQSNVYKAIFNETYNAHNAKDDVEAMIRIYNYLENGVVNRTQLELI